MDLLIITAGIIIGLLWLLMPYYVYQIWKNHRTQADTINNIERALNETNAILRAGLRVEIVYDDP